MPRIALLLLLALSPLCALAAVSQVKPAVSPDPSQNAPIKTAQGTTIMVTGGPVVELQDYTPTPEPRRWCVVDTGGPALLLRSTPELDPKSFDNTLAAIVDGTRLEVLGISRTNGRTRTWYHVLWQGEVKDLQGWVAGQWCRMEGKEE